MLLFAACSKPKYLVFWPLPRWLKVKGPLTSIAVNGTPSQSYGTSLAIWDHTVLPATWHKRTCPALTPAMQSGTRFTNPGGMKGWVDLVDLIVPRPGVEPVTFRSGVQRLHHQDNYTFREWVNRVSRVLHPARHIIGHFRDESFQAITCTRSDRKYTKKQNKAETHRNPN